MEQQRWLTEWEFVDLLTLGQLLPGPNVLNLTVMVGYRFAGWTGAAAAVAGFLGGPCLVVIGMGVLYQEYGALPQVQRALAGMSIVAAGLLLATVIKLAKVLPRQWRPWLFGILAFVGVGILSWPLLWVMGGLAPWAVFAAWKEKERWTASTSARCFCIFWPSDSWPSPVPRRYCRASTAMWWRSCS